MYEPQFGMEDCIEQWFGAIKTIRKDIKGSVTLPNAIAGAHLLHQRQKRSSPQAGRMVGDGGNSNSLGLLMFSFGGVEGYGLEFDEAGPHQ